MSRPNSRPPQERSVTKKSVNKNCGDKQVVCAGGEKKVVPLDQDTFGKLQSDKTTKHSSKCEMFHENGVNQEGREGVMLLHTKCIFHVLFIQRQLL